MQVRDIFIEALQIDDPAKRAAHLAAACGDDSALKSRVEGLLARKASLDVPAGGSGNSPIVDDRTHH